MSCGEFTEIIGIAVPLQSSVEVTASETNKHRRFGLSNGNTNQSWDDIDFCIYLEGSGTVYINEGATPRGSFGSYATGDVFRVAVEGGVVKYRKNGTLLYTSTVSPTYPLLVDTALYSTGATLTNAMISTGAAAATLHWLITDQLGTPRMILDQSGALANMKRHDYLPFGEELFAPTSSRTAVQGYVSGDSVRQQFTSKERDVQTRLDYFIHRYYGSIEGRFTSADGPFVDQSEPDPQSWNLYTYVGNNPTNALDPLGLWKEVDCDNGGRCFQAENGDTWATLYVDAGFRGGFLPAQAALMKYYFQATPEIVPGETVVDVSGFMSWVNSLKPLERTNIASDPRYTHYEVDFVGGGIRDVTKAASEAGLFTRLLRWLGFGKKVTPVAQEGVAALRQAYEAEVRALAIKAAQMRADGHSVEEIARELHAERRALGIKYKDVTPPEILQKILERNRQVYGDELGPTIEWLRAQGKSWEQIIESASRPGGQDLKP